MLKNILFDFDGTLADTNDLVILSLRETSKRFLNKDLSQEELNNILGRHLEDQMRRLSNTMHTDMMAFYREFYNLKKDEMTVAFPGIAEMLAELKSLGCKFAVVSSKGRSGIEHGLNHLGIEQYFDVTISTHDIENNKPHPEPAFKAMEALDANAETSIFVGDSTFDILCGKNAGIKTVLVDWTIFPKKELLELCPDFIIETPKDLVNVIRHG